MNKLNKTTPKESGEYIIKVQYGNGTTDNFYMICYFNKSTEKFSIEVQSSSDGENDYFYREILLPVIEWAEIPKSNLSFQESTKPLMKWLSENKHPHHSVIVTSTTAELLEGITSHNTNEFLGD